MIAESSSSRDEEEEEGPRSDSSGGSGSGRDRQQGEKRKMVTVPAASKEAVAGYMGAVKAAEAGRTLSAAANEEEEQQQRPLYFSSAWELLKTMFEGLLPQAALDAAYSAHHHRRGDEGGEGEGDDDLAAMVEVRGVCLVYIYCGVWLWAHIVWALTCLCLYCVVLLILYCTAIDIYGDWRVHDSRIHAGHRRRPRCWPTSRRRWMTRRRRSWMMMQQPLPR